MDHKEHRATQAPQAPPDPQESRVPPERTADQGTMERQETEAPWENQAPAVPSVHQVSPDSQEPPVSRARRESLELLDRVETEVILERMDVLATTACKDPPYVVASSICTQIENSVNLNLSEVLNTCHYTCVCAGKIFTSV